jgi:linoleoyl-CoA desaturase
MAKVVFNNKDHSFLDAVRKEANGYFQQRQIKPTGNIHLYLKAALFIFIAIACYCYLLFALYPLLIGIVVCMIFGLSLAGIAMNVMHDACHGSFSSKKWVNNLFSLSMNAMGSNAWLWKIRHNIIHHTYTNIDGMDNDIANWPILRQSPTQRRLGIHRFQHIYMYLLYGFTTLHWMFWFDFEKYFRRRFTNTRISRISFREHFVFWTSKLLYILFYIIIPIYYLGVQPALIGFLTLHLVMGVVLIIVFQLAHIVEKVEFDVLKGNEKQIQLEWAVHEVKTTANFAPRNKFVNWYLGGLNYQIEHHLFPQVCHLHYPALSNLVKSKCDEFGLPYNSYDSLGAALTSHARLMKKLGRVL